MNKFLLNATFISALCFFVETNGHANETITPPPQTTAATTTSETASENTPSVSPNEKNQPKNTEAGTSLTPENATKTLETTPTTPALPSIPEQKTTTTVMPNPTETIDCNYHFKDPQASIDEKFVMKWAEQATEQSFNFQYETIQEQLALLKSCYTEQGWQSFNDALQKSGNVNAMKSQKLNSSSMVDGTASVTNLKENQWRVSIPLQVVYQNEQEKLTQPLTVDVLIGRKPSGDLGIMQMIAAPRDVAPPGNNPPANTENKP